MKQLNLGVISLGRIGKCHLENLVQRIPAANVTAISDHSGKNISFAENHRVPHIFQKATDVINHPKVEAVVICSPSNFHFEHIEAAAMAGKHIFSEKPLDLSIEKIEEIERIVAQQKVKLQVGFNKRFDVNFSKVRNMVQSGKIGDPHILRISSRDPGLPPIEYLSGSGGLFLDMTIHDFDMARFIVGSEVEEVFARGAVLVDEKVREVGDIDTATVSLKFENGCLGLIDNSRQAIYGYDQRLEIFGSKGMSKVDNNYPNAHTYYDQKGRHAEESLNFFMERYKESYCSELSCFVDVVLNDEPVPVSSKDALMATKIALAANQSLRENKAVKLSDLH